MNPLLIQFCTAYGITDTATFDKLYEVEEVVLFLPPNPTEKEKKLYRNSLASQGYPMGIWTM